MYVYLLVLMRSCGGRLESWLPWRSRCSRMHALSTVWGRLVRRLLDAFSSCSWGIEKILCVCVSAWVCKSYMHKHSLISVRATRAQRFLSVRVSINSSTCMNWYKMSHLAGSSVSLLSLAFNFSRLLSSVRASGRDVNSFLQAWKHCLHNMIRTTTIFIY